MKIKKTAGLPETISLACTTVSLKNDDNAKPIWTDLIDPLIKLSYQNDTLDTIRGNFTIQETKKLYKLLGKDPTRFRPSSDSLWRRVVQGKGLYKVNPLVDLNNYLSLKFHLPFGSYDLEKIGKNIFLSKGSFGQTYQGIGKGDINLTNLLLLSDNEGPFGSPTSDSTRAMISKETKQALIVGYMFNQPDNTKHEVQAVTALLVKKYLRDSQIIEQFSVN